MGRRKPSKNFIESLDCDEDDKDGFSENNEPTGKVLMSFNFTGKPEPSKAIIPIEPETPDKLIDNRTLHTQPYCIIPPIDGERFVNFILIII